LVTEHPYREPVWAQLITAYYLSGRQSDALDAYRRLTAILSDDLGIDPNAVLRDLHGRILRQDPLDVLQSAQATAEKTLSSSLKHSVAGSQPLLNAWLHSTEGHTHPVKGQATSIGRRSDNDIVLADAKASRRHAVIVDTGMKFVIFDTESANGIEVGGERVNGSAPLSDGDFIRIGNSGFVFETHRRDDDADTGPIPI
jgi:hypothetical protein